MKKHALALGVALWAAGSGLALAKEHAEHGAHAPAAAHAHTAHWGYEGATGPAHWGDLDPGFSTCKTGRNQSPVNLDDTLAVGTVGLPAVDIAYGTPALNVINNGHTVQVNYPAGSYIKVGGHRFDLLQFHFHTPSEHQHNGENLPMEMHLVHKDAHGNLAVIGILYRTGAENPELQKLIDHLPADIGKAHTHEQVHIDLTKFFPHDRRFYKYSGSLTTPPCSEGVYWMVFRQPIEASEAQIAALQKLLGHNNRPVQPHYARHMLKSWSGQ
ncbi:carbonic anhydrase [Sulfurivirga sp.]|uniref:carbonic anhydrase n=1 Tax=Sulfurivirga sp. TaxID=2614236 RepID=UPI0025DBD1E9|nr:carbonic anhydrase family protein [Sulfurivirga sp.]